MYLIGQVEEESLLLVATTVRLDSTFVVQGQRPEQMISPRHTHPVAGPEPFGFPTSAKAKPCFPLASW